MLILVKIASSMHTPAHIPLAANGVDVGSASQFSGMRVSAALAPI